MLSAEELGAIQSATLHVPEDVWVAFPSERALRVFADHGAQVETHSQVVRLSPDLGLEAMGHAPLSCLLSRRHEGTGLRLNLDAAARDLGR